ncbi:cell division protein FtsL [Kiloniella sp.]|uniref:cell division protein FtsL n=1 Tax=Kiloniella sp. TaxID=1938587 RepID=UPI003B02588F
MKNLVLTLWIVVGTACAIVLFQVKHEVTDLEDQLASVEAKIKSDKQTIRILQAEWSYLNRPERLARLSSRYLDLKPLDPAQIVTVENLPRLDEQFDGGTNIKLPGAATPTSTGGAQ